MPCTADTASVDVYGCEKVCGKLLDCGKHACPEKCHPVPCGTCERDPKVFFIFAFLELLSLPFFASTVVSFTHYICVEIAVHGVQFSGYAMTFYCRFLA